MLSEIKEKNLDVKVATLLAALFLSNGGLILSTYVSMRVAQAIIETKVDSHEKRLERLESPTK